jgi:centromere/kinetochore protein ZW10
MEDYEKALTQVGNFATALDTLKWPGGEGLHDWVSHAPRIWLNKRRETALESMRLQLSMGTLDLNV